MGTATYCPEDNKLRLYIGRVPREEYLKLKSEGWTTLHKQRDAGGGDFVATWTPERRNTALSYSDDGIIEDEDMGPEERAADRAERFGGYRDKRTTDAVGHADNYDSQPSAHGYQNEQRAERAAARHDRIADRACDAWSKAEYWQRRTEGVIRHALYKSSPGVRMGRIKDLESLIRKKEADIAEHNAKIRAWQKVAAMADPDQTAAALYLAGHMYCWSKYPHPATGKEQDLYDMMRGENPITGKQAAEFYLSDHKEYKPEDSDWWNHYKLRLAYENQMLAAQGGMLEQFEVLVGGKLGGKLILRVNKSPATGRATSVSILGPKVQGWTYKASNIPGTEWAEHQFDLERMEPEAYTPPTEESLAELAKVKAAIKAAAPKKPECPLINPTDEDAERLQALWNTRGKAERDAREGSKYMVDFQPSTICRITQAVYSQNSKGAYARAEARGLCRNAELMNSASNLWSSEREERAKRIGAPICKVRITSSDSDQWPYVKRVIVLTDKPQKPLPVEVWEKIELTEPEPKRGACILTAENMQTEDDCTMHDHETAATQAELTMA